MEKSTQISTKIKYQKKALNASVILIDSFYEKYKIYYLQVFLVECKYDIKEKRSLSLLLTT